MIDWFTNLDPTVQVTIIGPLVAAIIAFPAWIITYLKPRNEQDKNEYAPKAARVTIDETDRLRLDRLIFVLESFTDTLERHRVEVAQLRYRPN